jgi:hypothetical protein
MHPIGGEEEDLDFLMEIEDLRPGDSDEDEGVEELLDEAALEAAPKPPSGDDYEVDEDEDEDGEPAAAAAPAPDDPDAPINDGSELHGYSQKVRNRVMREQRLKRGAQQEVQRLRGALSQAQEDARRFQAEGFESRNMAVKTAIDNLDHAYNSARQEYVNARDEGDVARETSAQEAMDDLRTRRTAITNAAAQLPTQVNPYRVQGLESPENHPALQQQGPPRNAPLADQWKTHNEWFSNRTFSIQRQAYLTLSDNLDKSGEYDPNSQAYYDELNRRMLREFPGFPHLKTVTGKSYRVKGAAKKRRAPTTAPARGRQPARSSRAPDGRQRLTTLDYENMKKFGIDPSDAVAREAWRMNKT